MVSCFFKRRLLSRVIAISLISIGLSISALSSQAQPVQNAQAKLAHLEKSFDGKIGVYAINTGNNQIIAYRADQLFPVQSTSKLLDVAALFKQSDSAPGLLQKKIHYTQSDLMMWHPITGKYLATGMTLEALSGAAMSYSDNPAANLIIKEVGGPAAVTSYAHSIGNKSFNLEHSEGTFNSNPNNSDDSATPKDMAISLQKLTLGNALTEPQRAQLVTWMTDNTTSYKRMRSGVPIGWTIADKTGSGDYGIANDIGILWSPLCKPIVLAIYTVQGKQDAQIRDDIVASTTNIVLNEFAKTDPCFKALFN